MKLHRGCTHQEELGSMEPCEKCEPAVARERLLELEEENLGEDLGIVSSLALDRGVIIEMLEQQVSSLEAQVEQMRHHGDDMMKTLEELNDGGMRKWRAESIRKKIRDWRAVRS